MQSPHCESIHSIFFYMSLVFNKILSKHLNVLFYQLILLCLYFSVLKQHHEGHNIEDICLFGIFLMDRQCKWKMAFSIWRLLPSGCFENAFGLRTVFTEPLIAPLKQHTLYSTICGLKDIVCAYSNKWKTFYCNYNISL